MSSINQVVLVGRLGKDPELKYTPSQVAVATFSLATSSQSKDAQGNKSEVTEWHNIVVFGKQAEFCSQYLKKGRMAGVTGRIRYRSWDKPDNTKGYITEIVSDNVTFLPGGEATAKPQQAAPAQAPNFPQNTGPDKQATTMAQAAAQMDDIPF